MSAAKRYCCPVCHRDIRPTSRGVIGQHYDSILAERCPASGEPYRIMIERQPEFLEVAS